MTTASNPTPSSAPVVDDEHPWLGLVAYTEKTQGFFFGRDAEIAEIFTRVRENPLTILFGQSGLGKSSLLGAGLIPKLRAERYRPVLIRFDFSENGPSLTTQANTALCQALEMDLPSGFATLWEILHHLPSQAADLRELPPVLIFDQFEEIFTLASPHDNEVKQWFIQIGDLVENRPPTDLQQRFRGDRQLARQYDSAPSPARIVVTLREEYLSQLEQWKGMLPSLMRNRMPLYRLTGPQALQATVGPGRLSNRPIISEQVGAQIVRKVARRSNDTPLESIEAVPPFLSLLCEQLNAARFMANPPLVEITSDLVITHGDDILDSYYEASFQEQPAAVRCFVEDRLVSLGGHRNTVIREDAINELGSAGVADPDLFIDALISRRLLTTEERGGFPRLELTHDVLTPLVIRSRATRQKQEAVLEAQRQRRRQTGIIAALLAVVLVFAGLAGFGLYSFLRAERESRKAQSTLSRSYFLQGIENIAKDRSDIGLAYLANSIRHHPDRQNASAAARIVNLFIQKSFALPLTGPMRHEGPVNSAVFSPDGTRIVTASEESTVRIWDAVTGKPLKEPMSHIDAVKSAMLYSVNSAVFSPDGTKIVTASEDSTARVWDGATGKPWAEPMKHRDSVNSAVFSQDGAKIVTASDDSTARIWDAVTGKPLTEPMFHKDAIKSELLYSVNSAVFSPDGAKIVTASDDSTARVWDGATGKPWTEPMRHKWAVFSAVFNQDGTKIVTASADNTARVWDTDTGKPLTKPMRHKDVGLSTFLNSVNSAVFSSDGARIVTSSNDSTARVWDADTGEPWTDPMYHEDWVTSAVFSPDGARIVTASRDKTARVWDGATGKPLTEPMRHEGEVKSAVFSQDGTRIVTASDDSTARVWDGATCKPMTEPMFHKDAVKSAMLNSVNSAVFSPDGAKIVTVSDDSTARVWDGATGKPLTEPMRSKDVVFSAMFNQDGTKIVTASMDKTARVWDADTGKPWTEPMFHKNSVTSAVFSPDGARIVTASDDSTARVWDADTGKPLTKPMFHKSYVSSAVFSQDGTKIVTVSMDKTARVWDADTGQSLTEPMRHEDTVYSAVFSPDGARIVTVSSIGHPDHIARVWDTDTGQSLTEPMRHKEYITSAVFSPDGTKIVTASDDDTARVWDADTGKPWTEPMHHKKAVKSTVFSQDGARIVTASGTSTRVWDAVTGKPLTDPIRHEYGVTSVMFSPDGARIFTVSENKTVRVWPIAPLATVPIPDWLPSLAEAVGGYRINDQGVLEAVKADQLLEFRKQFKEAKEKDPYSQIARWFFADKSTRPNSPYRMDEKSRGE